MAIRIPSTLSHIAPVERLSQRVVRILGLNPSPMTLQGTNSYLIGSGRTKILIDTTSPEDQQSPHISRYIDNLTGQLEKSKLSLILLTHWHIDHIGAVSETWQHLSQLNHLTDNFSIRKFPHISGHTHSSSYPQELKIFEDHFREMSKRFDEKWATLTSSNCPIREDLHDGEIISTDDGETTLEIIATPGHCKDHIGFFLKEEAALFTGDAVLGEGSTTFENLSQYLRSLDKFKLFDAKVLYPSHGKLVFEKPNEWIDAYITNRLSRENTILEKLECYPNQTLEDVTRNVYGSEIATSPLFPAAMHNTWLHLDKLITEEKICMTKDEFGSTFFTISTMAKL